MIETLKNKNKNSKLDVPNKNVIKCARKINRRYTIGTLSITLKFAANDFSWRYRHALGPLAQAHRAQYLLFLNAKYAHRAWLFSEIICRHR